MVGPYCVHLELKVLQELYEDLGDGIRAEYTNAWQHTLLLFHLLLYFTIFLNRCFCFLTQKKPLLFFFTT